MIEPRIFAFLCKWCAYAGADLAGTIRKRYDPNLISIRVTCSGRVDPTHVVKALEAGYDGVLIAGCHPGTCHYINGNYKALRRFALLQRLLKQMGIPSQRVRLEWISASESDKFVTVVNDMVRTLRELEPNERSRELKATPSVPRTESRH
jgi:F420-non-reducing hydrogenase iron-sulfur subunit